MKFYFTKSIGRSTPNWLKKIKVKEIPLIKCRADYKLITPGGITDQMLCAKELNGMICSGDGGNGLVTSKNQKSYDRWIDLIWC